MNAFLIPGILALGAMAQSVAAETWPASLTNECDAARPQWIWCEDFEVDRSSDYFEGRVVRQTGAGLGGSAAAAFTFTEGKKGAGGIKIAFGRTPHGYMKPVDDGTADYREIYWRMFVRLPDDWVGNGADKLSRATVLADARWSQAMIAHVWSGPDPGPKSHRLLLDPASGTDAAGNLRTRGYNDFDNLRWLGQRYSGFGVFAPENFGRWHCVEAHVKLNSASANDGIFRLFINGKLENESTSLNWLGNYDGYGINAVFFENYWNNGSPVTQTRYFDNLVISTQRIGCG